MYRGGLAAAKAGLVGTIVGGLYGVARNSEKKHVLLQSKIETQKHIEVSNVKLETSEDSLAFQKKFETTLIYKFRKIICV